MKAMRGFAARMPTPPSLLRTRERLGEDELWARIERKRAGG